MAKFKHGDKVVVLDGTSLVGTVVANEYRAGEGDIYAVSINSFSSRWYNANELAADASASAAGSTLDDLYRSGDFSVYYDDEYKEYIIASGGGDPLSARATLDEAKAIADAYAKQADEAPDASTDGVDVQPSAFAQAAQGDNALAVAMYEAAVMTTEALEMHKRVDELEAQLAAAVSAFAPFVKYIPLLLRIELDSDGMLKRGILTNKEISLLVYNNLLNVASHDDVYWLPLISEVLIAAHTKQAAAAPTAGEGAE
jgi:hypothetical protein